jgi:hypothetical protein
MRAAVIDGPATDSRLRRRGHAGHRKHIFTKLDANTAAPRYVEPRTSVCSERHRGRNHHRGSRHMVMWPHHVDP